MRREACFVCTGQIGYGRNTVRRMEGAVEISQGLCEGMVAQRTADNMSDIALTGTCRGSGEVTARVMQAGVAVHGFDGVGVGEAKAGKFTGRLAGIPVGGPYQVDLQIAGTAERLRLRDIYIGDLWILGGQSNMQGCALQSAALPAIPAVRAFYMNDRWAPARDPIHNLWDAVDAAHTLVFEIKPVETPGRGVGPGVAFGQAMYELTGVPQGLLACAHGGTSMGQWNPRLKNQGGKSLYGATVRRVMKNGGRVAGVVWYQGCSDANPENAPLYMKRMKELIAAFRRDSGDPDLPFVAVQIAGVYNTAFDTPAWNSVQVQQDRLQESVKRCAVVPAIDLEYDDQIHLDGPSQHRLGRRLAKAMLAVIAGDPLRRRGIKVKKVTTRPNLTLGSMDVVIDFDHVVGQLHAAGKPSGFTLISQAGDSLLYKVEVAGSRVTLHSSLMMWEIDHKELWYGYGVTPYCNITDDEDRPLPVFGPILIGKLRALSPFVRTLRVSPALPLDGPLKEQPLPAPDLLHSRTFTEVNHFLNIYEEWRGNTEPQFIWFACRINCPEAMELSLSLGYDGPVVAWLDGRQVFEDPRGSNPAVPDEKMLPCSAAPGEHEVMVALSSNANRAWGIYLRFERRDVTKRQVAGGEYTMPGIREIADETVLLQV